MTERKITRQSIQPTYDSRETGPRYNVSSFVNDKPVSFMDPIDDPFVRHTVHVGLWDLLKAVCRGRLKVEVTVGGDKGICDDVLELDANTLIGGSSRRVEFDRDIGRALVRHVKGEEAAASEAGDLDDSK